MAVERNRLRLADTLGAMSPIAGAVLASAAISIRHLSVRPPNAHGVVTALQETPREDAKRQRLCIAENPSASNEPTCTDRSDTKCPDCADCSDTRCPDRSEDPTLSATTDTIVPTDTTHRPQGDPTPPIKAGEPTEPTPGKNPLLSFAPSRVIILRHVLANRAHFDREFTPWSRVGQDTGLSHIAVKRAVKDMADRGIIRVEFDQLHRRGSRVYVREEYARMLMALDKSTCHDDPTWCRPVSDLTDLTTSQKYAPTDPNDLTDPSPLKKDRIRKIHPSEDDLAVKLGNVTDELVDLHWPDLFKVGFRADEIHRIVKARLTVGKPINRMLMEGLDHANFVAREHKDTLLDGKGKPVGSLAGYFYNSLVEKGYYGRPAGYVSSEEKAEKDREEEATRVVEARKRREWAECQAWLDALKPGEREAILLKHKDLPGTENGKLIFAWNQEVKKMTIRCVEPGTTSAE